MNWQNTEFTGDRLVVVNYYINSMGHKPAPPGAGSVIAALYNDPEVALLLQSVAEEMDEESIKSMAKRLREFRLV